FLEEIGIDGAGSDAVFSRQALQVFYVGEAVGHVPQHMQRECGCAAGEPMDFAGVREFFFNAGGGGWLQELSEARAGVGESPGRNLDAEIVKRLEDSCFRVNGHAVGHLVLWRAVPWGGLREWKHLT